MYTVKETAKLLGLSEHTIRFYTDQDLIPSVTRDKNNNRLFDEQAINWLTGVKYLRDSGMPLKSVKEYVELCLVGDSTIDVRYQIILRQRELAKAQVAEAQRRLTYMEEKVKLYRDIAKHKIPDRMNPATWPTGSTG